jgi:hypothetical protein
MYMLPESFAEMPFEVFRSFKRGQFSIFDKPEEGGTSLSWELCQFLCRHFSDPQIPNPDSKEAYLTRLNYFMQFQQYIEQLEKCEHAQVHLLPSLLKAFDKRYIILISKNILRLCKARGFKEMSF